MSGLEDIGSILGRALGGSAPDARLAAVCSAWRAAAGPLADEVWPARFARDGGLILNCTSAVLAGDLTMRSPELLATPPGAGLRAARAALPRGPRAGSWWGLTTGRIASIHPGSPHINRNFWDGSLTDSEHEYGADEITVLEGLEAVRKRPGMYIGATSQRGLHHLVYEVLDNSVDEALAGYCDQITTTLLPDGSISVRDNGRGIPVERNEKYDMSTVQVVLTMLHAGGKFGGGGYKVSGGLHGVGVSVVNALSEWLTVEVRRDGFAWTQSFARGEPTTELVQGEPTTSSARRSRSSPTPTSSRRPRSTSRCSRRASARWRSSRAACA